MKGGVVLSLGAMRQLVKRPQDYAEIALLVVCDEEWRKGPLKHVERFAGWDACLCFEGGERTKDGDDAVVVRRKAAGRSRSSATAARRTRAPLRTRGATRCSRSGRRPARWRPATTPTGRRT